MNAIDERLWVAAALDVRGRKEFTIVDLDYREMFWELWA